MEQGLAEADSPADFASRIGCSKGISGYIISTVSAVLFCWLRWPNEFRRPVEAIVMMGGDADSTASVLGGLAGATCGESSIPTEWLTRLAEWPYSVTWMRTVLVPALQSRFWSDASGTDRIKVRRPLPALLLPLSILARNLIFLIIVLGHGLRRLFPPW